MRRYALGLTMVLLGVLLFGFTLHASNPIQINPTSNPVFIAGDGGAAITGTGSNMLVLASNAAQRVNALVNGDFKVWTYGTTNVSISSIDTYTADRWITNAGTTGSETVSQVAMTVGQTAVPGEPEYSLQIQQTAQATVAGYLEQKILDVRTLAGLAGIASSPGAQLAVTLSWYQAVSAGGPVVVTPQLVQNFGSGGSGAVTTVGAATTTSGTTFQRYSVTFTVPSVTGKTMGTDNTSFVAVQFLLPITQTFTVQFADIQLEAGFTPTAYRRRTFDQELLDVEYFHTRLNGGAETPASCLLQCTTTTTCTGVLPYPRVMRVAPTITNSTASNFNVTQANGTNQALTAISFTSIGTLTTKVTGVVAANLVAGNATQLIGQSGTFIDLSSEL